MAADITVFDPERIRDVATFEDPNRYSEGVSYVVVNGRVVLDDGQLTTLDERAVYERAETLARRQIARAGLTIESKWPVVE